LIRHLPTETPDRMDRKKILRVAVSTARRSKPRLVELSQPCAVVGRADKADITLEGGEISFRHAYLQRLADRVICFDLSSKTGTYWGDKRRHFGWLSPRKAVRIGRYSLSVLDDLADGEEPVNGDQTNLLAPQLDGLDHSGRYVLEFFDDSLPEPIREIKHEIALVGRSPKCHIQVDDESVSRVHCALVPTVEGLLVVDLLGRGGTRVDDKSIRWSYVETGSVLTIGRYEMSVWHRTSASAWDENATVPAATASLQTTNTPDAASIPLSGPRPGSNDVDTESAPAAPHDPTIEQTALLNTEKTRDDASPEPVADWLGTLFAIEHHGSTLVVIPTISDGMFRYAKLRTEASSLRRKLALPDLRGLVIDLRALGYVGWEAISIVVALAREMEASGGSAAFCCPTPQVQQVLTNMGLSRIWPAHPTREAALAAVRSRSPEQKLDN
jgi:anti-anti-sigma factor